MSGLNLSLAGSQHIRVKIQPSFEELNGKIGILSNTDNKDC